jgi:hypothetical protein
MIISYFLAQITPLTNYNKAYQRHFYLKIKVPSKISWESVSQRDKVTKTITMTQPGLIESVLADLHLLNESKTKDTQSLGILYPDQDGIPQQDKWSYHSVIGKLNYIAQNTRPDISFAAHQCTRYSSNPTALQELAVKLIVRYLLATKEG